MLLLCDKLYQYLQDYDLFQHNYIYVQIDMIQILIKYKVFFFVIFEYIESSFKLLLKKIIYFIYMWKYMKLNPVIIANDIFKCLL